MILLEDNSASSSADSGFIIVVDPSMDLTRRCLRLGFSLRPERASDIVATDFDVGGFGGKATDFDVGGFGGKDEAAAEEDNSLTWNAVVFPFDKKNSPKSKCFETGSSLVSEGNFWSLVSNMKLSGKIIECVRLWPKIRGGFSGIWKLKKPDSDSDVPLGVNGGKMDDPDASEFNTKIPSQY